MQLTPYRIANFLNAPVGTEASYMVSEMPEDLTNEDPLILSPISFSLTLLKAKGRIEVNFADIKTTVYVPCIRCLINKKQVIHIPMCTHTYLMTEEHVENKEDEEHFIVDSHRNLIHIEEALRGEIFLASDEFALCKKTCKGLCPLCGVNLNTHNCSCDKTEIILREKTYQPFANLKKILPTHKNKK